MASPAPTSSRATDGQSSTAASCCSASRWSSPCRFAPLLLPFRLAYHLLGFAYNWPLFGGRRIKQLYFWKNTASAMGFMLTVFAYPLAWARGQLWYGITWSTVAATAVYFFLFELSYEIIYDLRDAPGDARADVRTYPVVHGAAASTRIIDALCIASLIVLAGSFGAHVVPWRIAILGVGPLLQIFLYKRFVKRGITSRDCINLTWLGAALLRRLSRLGAGRPARRDLVLALELVCAAIVALYAVARRDALPSWRSSPSPASSAKTRSSAPTASTSTARAGTCSSIAYRS